MKANHENQTEFDKTKVRDSKTERHPFQVDLTTGVPLVRIFLYSIPHLIVFLITFLITPMQQSIYSQHVGMAAFAVPAVLLQFFLMMSSVTVSGYGLNANIVTLAKISKKDPLRDQYFCMAFYSQILLSLVFCVLAMVLYQPIFQLLAVPESLYQEALVYYFCYLISFVLTSVCNFLSTLYFGTGSFLRNVVFQVATPVGNLLSAYVLLAVFDLKTAGIGLLAIPATVIMILIFLRSVVKCNEIRCFMPSFSFVKQNFWPYFKDGCVHAIRCLVVAVSYLFCSLAVNRTSDEVFLAAIGIDMPILTVLGTLGSTFHIFCVKNCNLGNRDHLKKGFRQAIFGFGAFAVVLMGIYWFFGDAYLNAIGIEDPVKAKALYCFRVNSIGFIGLSLLYSVRYFFEAIGEAKISLAAGLVEVVYCLLAAVYLIPAFGDFFASSYRHLAWTFSGIFCVIVYFIKRKAIWASIGK